MEIDVTPLTAAGALAATLLAPALTLIGGGAPADRRRSISTSLALAVSAGVGWILVWALTRPELDARLVLPVGGLAGLASVLVTVPLRRRPLGFLLVIVIVWTAGVYSPVAIAVFSTSGGILGSTLGTLDLGGACAVFITSGFGLAVLLIVGRRAPIDEPGATPRGVIPGFAVVWVLWVIWLVGLELVIDDVTPRIVINAVIAPITSAAAWLIVQRIRRVRSTSTSIVGGLFCGLVAVTAGCGYLDPLGAVLTGGIAGVICSFIGHGLVRRTGREVWLLAIVLSVGASAGVTLLGVFATRAGLMFTGQPEVLFSQFASAALTAVYSVVVSLLIWLGALRIGRNVRQSVASDRP